MAVADVVCARKAAGLQAGGRSVSTGRSRTSDSRTAALGRNACPGARVAERGNQRRASTKSLCTL